MQGADSADGPDPVGRLVERAREGDEAAYRALYERHAASVHGYCRSFARGDLDLAAELCQESFVTAFRELRQLRDADAFPGFLRRICRRTCLRWAERRRTETAGLAQLTLAVAEPDPPASGRASGRVDAVLAEVLQACPDPGTRRSAELFYGDPPHTTEQIAAALGVSRTVVTTRLYRFRIWARASFLTRLLEALEAP